MAKEIERKFLVNQKAWTKQGDALAITQGYISVDPERTVRVRIIGSEAYLTIKGKTSGITRDEFEYPIPLADAMDLLKMTIYPPLEKIRHHVNFEGKLWEVDEFLGANSGLMIAEIELLNENEALTKPTWIAEEVSGNKQYYNSSLVKYPFNEW